jgi:large subunit ribosomal protein L9
MRVLLIKDVYKLGHAGDVKKVADGYGRNYLMTMGLAVLATPGSLKQVDHIRAKAAVQRAVLNNEMSGLAEQMAGQVLNFTSKAGETGKLYGSITTQQIADAVNEKFGSKVDHRQIEIQPIRMLGEHKARVRLTIDLTPEIKINVLREGEAIPEAVATAPAVAAPAEAAPAPAAEAPAPAAEAPAPAAEAPAPDAEATEPAAETKTE